MTAFVLIHGAWHGAWCWRKLVPLLEDAGHMVVAPDLPGHGDDNTPPEKVDLEAYVNTVTGILDRPGQPVVLAGHSMAGFVITEAAERRPDSIQALVYLAAFLPGKGKSLTTMEQRNPHPAVPPNLVVAEDGLTATIREEKVKDLFYHDCSEEDILFARSNLCPQATGLLDTPVNTSDENFGRVPRYYIECSEDRALCHEYQKIMVESKPGTKTFVLEASHSPFFSMPRELADILIQIAEMS